MAYDLGTEESPVKVLEERLGASWVNIDRAHQVTIDLVNRLGSALAEPTAADCSFVVFGSLARGEAVAQSDLDWALLIDGLGDPKHQELVHEIEAGIPDTLKQPGREGTFGRMIISHDLIHRIGGEEDTNKNTTYRILLLLESLAIGRTVAYERVVRSVLERYLGEDRGLWFGRSHRKVPRFLLNDIVRYWRTLTVDFAYKQYSRGGQGFALRNVKLRLSRKLIFISGLVLCFVPTMNLDESTAKELFSRRKNIPRLIELLLPWLNLTPLEKLASMFLEINVPEDAVLELFDSYDAFLGLVSDPAKREELDEVEYDGLGASDAFDEGLSYSSRFQKAVDRLFLRGDTLLTELTLKYGVF